MTVHTLPVRPHPTYEDGSPMLLGDQVIVRNSGDEIKGVATLIEIRFHPDDIVWMFVQGEGFYRNEVIIDHKSGRASYIREKASQS